jgi:hypothetical protein
MVTKDRDALKKLFGNDAIPTAKNFEALIESMLNKRDDMFFGKWRSGIGYKKGDVVLHDDRLFYFNEKGVHEPQKDGANKDKKCDCKDGDCCGNNPPGSCPCWQALKIDNNDHDWEFIFDTSGKKVIGMYSTVSSNVGIGTTAGVKPEGLLHLSGLNSQFVFNPTGADFPTFKIINAQFGDVNIREPDFVTHQLEESKAIIGSNTLGFLFRQFPSVLNQHETNEAASLHAPEDRVETQGLSLLFVTSEKSRPSVGIGTEKPKAMLDITDGEHRQILLNPVESSEPEFILINLNAENAPHFLAARVSENQAVFTTDAPDGFAFKVASQDSDEAAMLEKEGDTKLVIDSKGNVGIGTETPVNKLDARTAAGSIQFSLDGNNPSLNIINLRPHDNPDTRDLEGANYLSIGANNEEAVFSTDSKNGFIFKKGETNNATTDINIDDGQAIFCLQPLNFEKGLFNAVMNGGVMSQGFYVESAPNKTLPEILPADALNLIRELKLYKFPDEDRPEIPQYGFKASNVSETKQGVKKIPDSDKKYIAYHNLVGILVATVKDLDERLKKLESEKPSNPKK